MDKDKLKMISAYVQQDDYFIGTMTVGEVMMFHVSGAIHFIFVFLK